MTALAPEVPLNTMPSTGPAARPPSLRMTRDAFRLGLEFDSGFIKQLEGHDIARFRLGARRFTSVSHPDYIDRVLHGAQPNYGRSFEYEVMKVAAGINLLTDEGDSWRRHRSMMTPMFAKRRIDGLIDLMTEPIAELGEGLHTDRPIDVNELMVDATLEVLGRAMFGRSFADLIRDTAGQVLDGMRSLEHLEHLFLLYAPPSALWQPFGRWVGSAVPAPPPVRKLQPVSYTHLLGAVPATASWRHAVTWRQHTAEGHRLAHRLGVLQLVAQHQLHQVPAGPHAREHLVRARTHVRQIRTGAGRVEQRQIAPHGARRLERVIHRRQFRVQQRQTTVAMTQPQVLVRSDVRQVPDER